MLFISRFFQLFFFIFFSKGFYLLGIDLFYDLSIEFILAFESIHWILNINWMHLIYPYFSMNDFYFYFEEIKLTHQN